MKRPLLLIFATLPFLASNAVVHAETRVYRQRTADVEAIAADPKLWTLDRAGAEKKMAALAAAWTSSAKAVSYTHLTLPTIA